MKAAFVALVVLGALAVASAQSKCKALSWGADGAWGALAWVGQLANHRGAGRTHYQPSGSRSGRAMMLNALYHLIESTTWLYHVERRFSLCVQPADLGDWVVQ